MERVPQSVLVTLLVIAIALAGYFYFEDRQSSGASTDSTFATTTPAQQEAIDLANKVGELVELPQGEIPIVATVPDLSKLQGQPFFVDAKVGDKVLIFNNAGKAVLYDPVANKVVNIAPVNTEGSTTP